MVLQQAAINTRNATQRITLGLAALASIIILSVPAVAGASPNSSANARYHGHNSHGHSNNGHHHGGGNGNGGNGGGNNNGGGSGSGYGGNTSNNLTINASASDGGVINIVVNYITNIFH